VNVGDKSSANIALNGSVAAAGYRNTASTSGPQITEHICSQHANLNPNDAYHRNLARMTENSVHEIRGTGDCLQPADGTQDVPAILPCRNSGDIVTHHATDSVPTATRSNNKLEDGEMSNSVAVLTRGQDRLRITVSIQV